MVPLRGIIVMNDLKYKGTPQLETERLILRRLRSEDENDIFEYASDEEVSRFVFWNTHRSIEDSRNFISFTLGRYDRDEAGEWGIVLKEEDKLIGTIGFTGFDARSRRAEIGYVLSRKYWGQGIMPEALNRLLEFAFTEMDLNRIECSYVSPNEKSGRVMQKVGMSYEGTAREKVFFKGRFWDLKQYAILKSDWVKKEKP